MGRLSEEISNSSVQKKTQKYKTGKIVFKKTKKHQGSGTSSKFKKQQQQFEKHFS